MRSTAAVVLSTAALLAGRLNPALSEAEPVSVLARDLLLVSKLIALLQPRNQRFNQTILSFAVDSKHQRDRN